MLSRHILGRMLDFSFFFFLKKKAYRFSMFCVFIWTGLKDKLVCNFFFCVSAGLEELGWQTSAPRIVCCFLVLSFLMLVGFFFFFRTQMEWLLLVRIITCLQRTTTTKKPRNKNPLLPRSLYKNRFVQFVSFALLQNALFLVLFSSRCIDR